ncbi:MAG: hypothetical protein CMB32_01180 [Euryarchaeota archaeon]|nr:hypothetical protein [Euryarchaeota archaeon]|tara:strand:+ start:4709 stop:5953 length:1245 start_codon:yes stop_codon:yes gene_type:complete
MRLSILIAFVLSCGALIAQGPDEYWIGLEEHVVHTEGELAGMTTYRMYLNMINPTDFLSACSGADENPWVLESTSTPAWYQHPIVSETFANAINPAFFTSFPELEYDSWLTIGASSSEDGVDISNVADPSYNAFAAFENGENINSDSPVGNLWFTLYPGLESPEDPGFAGDDLRVLVAQITTSGTISGSLYVQIFPEGVQDPDIRLLLPILYSPVQCNDETACNYNDIAWLDTDCVYGPSAGTIVGDDMAEVGGTQFEWTYTCDAGADTYEWSVNNGATIVSGQGTNSIVVDFTTAFGESCEVSVVATNGDDCTGEISTINVGLYVGVDELDMGSNLIAFPSPASTQVQINFESDLSSGLVDCQLHSMSGQLIRTIVITDGFATIDVSDLANGTYLLSLQTERGLVRESIVVSH